MQEGDDIVHLPIDGVLDLHTFSPSEVSSLVDDYLDECRKKGIYQVSIIHGKGKGVLRRIVHSALKKNPSVAGFHLDHGPSGWGATVVYLNEDSYR